jgi:hypothetical protein
MNKIKQEAVRLSKGILMDSSGFVVDSISNQNHQRAGREWVVSERP